MDGKSPCRQGSVYEKSSSPSPSSLSSSSWLNTKPKTKVKRGAWSAEEDTLLINYIQLNGVKGCWRKLPLHAGLMRSGKSCRLRWMNYLRPDVKIGGITPEEEDLIIRLHKLLGNRWSLIAGRLPGRTDNEIKNYWKGHIRRHLTKINNTPKASCKSTEEKRMESSPIDCGSNILQQVNQPIENDEKPFDLGTSQMGISRSMHVNINAFLEKKTSTTSSINYLESTQDYGSRPSFVTQVDASNIKSVPSIITEEGRNDMWSTHICQQIPWIDDYMHSSQISPISTYINAVYNLQGDMHALAHHFSFDDANHLMV